MNKRYIIHSSGGTGMQKINKASFQEKDAFYFASKIRGPPAL